MRDGVGDGVRVAVLDDHALGDAEVEGCASLDAVAAAEGSAVMDVEPHVEPLSDGMTLSEGDCDDEEDSDGDTDAREERDEDPESFAD